MDAVRDIDGTAVIVTGATSGIGLATVGLLIDAGARVTAVGRRPDRLRDIAGKFGDDSVHAVMADVRSPEENRRVVDEAISRWGRIDSIVVNAGIGIYGGILDGTDAEMLAMLETNLHSTVWAVRSIVPHFLERGGGDIVVVASVAGLRGGAHEAVYAATKFGQAGLAGAVDRELHAQGVRLTTICPAAVATEFAIGSGRTADMDMGGWLQADDVAEAITFTLRQPRRIRTTQLVLWSASEAG